MKKDLLKYIIKTEDEGLKLSNILRSRMNLSRRMVTGMKKDEFIYLNGKPVHTGVLVKAGDEVAVNLKKEERQNIEPQDIPIDVVFEDNDLLIVNKSPGMVVHPTKNHQEGTLCNGVLYYWKQRQEDNIVRLVNRLDRDTSGLVMIAKNQFSHQAMAKQMELGIVDKIYYAVVHGVMENREGTIDLPIDRPAAGSIKREVMKAGQRAVTHYKVIEIYDNASLVKLMLETGKTHQIRVHMTHIGHPLFGDTLYGEEDTGYIDRQALHAHMLIFNHPRNEKRMEIKAELPEDIKKLIFRLKV